MRSKIKQRASTIYPKAAFSQVCQWDANMKQLATNEAQDKHRSLCQAQLQ